MKCVYMPTYVCMHRFVGIYWQLQLITHCLFKNRLRNSDNCIMWTTYRVGNIH